MSRLGVALGCGAAFCGNIAGAVRRFIEYQPKAARIQAEGGEGSGGKSPPGPDQAAGLGWAMFTEPDWIYVRSSGGWGHAIAGPGYVFGIRSHLPADWTQGLGPRCGWPECRERSLVRLGESLYGCLTCKRGSMVAWDRIERVLQTTPLGPGIPLEQRQAFQKILRVSETAAGCRCPR